MGSGIDAAQAAGLPPEFAQALDDMKDQLILVLIQRLGGKVNIPAAEIDNTGGLLMTLAVNEHDNSFVFEVIKKQ